MPGAQHEVHLAIVGDVHSPSIRPGGFDEPGRIRSARRLLHAEFFDGVLIELIAQAGLFGYLGEAVLYLDLF